MSTATNDFGVVSVKEQKRGSQFADDTLVYPAVELTPKTRKYKYK